MFPSSNQWTGSFGQLSFIGDDWVERSSLWVKCIFCWWFNFIKFYITSGELHHQARSFPFTQPLQRLEVPGFLVSSILCFLCVAFIMQVTTKAFFTASIYFFSLHTLATGWFPMIPDIVPNLMCTFVCTQQGSHISQQGSFVWHSDYLGLLQ